MLSTVLTVVFILTMLLAVALQRGTRKGLALPSTVTTIGVLGTFVGISIGLMGFDVADIEGSVPQLLEGLKVAFLTSVAGMLIAIVLRMNPRLYAPPAKPEENEFQNTTLDDVAKLLREGLVEQKASRTALSHDLGVLRSALVGDGDTTLLTQTQKLRMTVSDESDAVREELRAFAQQIAENSTKALIEALNEVLEEFNTKINDQLGEEFRQLGEAVRQLLSWQERHTTELVRLAGSLSGVVDETHKCGQSLQGIADNHQRIETTCELLNEAYGGLTKLIEETDSRLETFQELGRKAVEALPGVETAIAEITRKLKDSTASATAELVSAAQTQREALEATVKAGELSMQSQSQALQEAQRGMHEVVQKSISQTTSDTQRLYAEVAKKAADQLQAFDEQLGQELDKAIGSLAGQLTSLSRTFVNDYTPLTERLKEILDISRRVAE